MWLIRSFLKGFLFTIGFAIPASVLFFFIFIVPGLQKGWMELSSEAVNITHDADVSFTVPSAGLLSVNALYRPDMSPLDPIKYGSYTFILKKDGVTYPPQSLGLKALDVYRATSENGKLTYSRGFNAEIVEPGNYQLSIKRISGECCYIFRVKTLFKAK